MEKIAPNNHPQDPFKVYFDNLFVPIALRPVIASIVAEMARAGFFYDRRTKKPLSLRNASRELMSIIPFSIDNQSRLRGISDASFNYEIGPMLVQFADNLALRVDEIWAKRAQKHYIDKIR